MLPNLIIIGGMKCGTTSLHYYLGLHPEISMSCEKELNFFIAERNWGRGVDWYASHFGGPAKIHGESSPRYTNYPFEDGVPERMHAVVPGARLIFLVRDPIERIISHYVHWCALGRETRTLEDALAGLDGNAYVTPSRYSAQLEQYLRHFPRSQILIVDSEDLLRRRGETLRVIFRFVGVDDAFTSRQFARLRYRARDQRRKTRLGQWLTPLTQRLATLQDLPAGLRWRLEALPYLPFSRPVARPTLDKGLRNKLGDLFRDDVARLRAFTGQAFADWNV